MLSGFPERVWEQNVNGLWSSRPAEDADRARREELTQAFMAAREQWQGQQ